MSVRATGRHSWSYAWMTSSGRRVATSRVTMSRYPCNAPAGRPPDVVIPSPIAKNARYIRLETSNRIEWVTGGGYVGKGSATSRGELPGRDVEVERAEPDHVGLAVG